MHLDAATCTEYDACVISEVFRDKGGIYEATPPLFVEKPGPEQLRKVRHRAGRQRRARDVPRIRRRLARVHRRREERLPAARRGRRAAEDAPRRARVVRDDADGLGGGFGRAARAASVVEAAAIAAGAAADKVTYGFVAEAEPTAEEKATAELAAKKRKAEAEVKATLEKAKEDAEAATGGIDWKAMRVVDDDEEAFYGTCDREKMKPKEYKYLDESAPMYESIEEADAAFEAAQKQKEADEKERAAEAAAGREAKTRAEKIAEEGDGHWHSKRAAAGACPWPRRCARSISTPRWARLACGRSGTTSTSTTSLSPLLRREAPRRTRRRSTSRWARWAPVRRGAARIAPRPLRNRKKSRARAFPRRTRAPGSSRWWTRTGTSARSSPWSETRGRRSLARSRRRLPSEASIGSASSTSSARRTGASVRGAGRGGARARDERARGLLAAGGAAVVAGAFAVTKRAKRRTASDAERAP